MADNYSEATVSTNIPRSLVSVLDESLLQALGFECEPADSEGKFLYFFQQERGCYMHIANLDLFLQRIKAAYPDTDGRPAWTTRLIEHLSAIANDTGKVTETEIDLDDLVIEAEQLFQDILNKPSNTGPDAIEEIVIMGAYYCSKMRQDEFGGWVSRITRDHIEMESTTGLLERLRHGKDETDTSNEMLYATASALSRLHDLFSEIVEEGRVNWASESEHDSVLAAFEASSSALGRTP